MLEQEILQALKEISGKLDCSKSNLSAINGHMKELVELEQEKKKRSEITLANENTIDASGTYKTIGVSNPGFNRCRLEIAAVFNSAASSGLAVQLIYGNSPVGKVFDLGPVNGSALMRSEPIDVKELGAFQFEITNNDTSYSVTMRKVTVILYND